jgi:hypothetical protein
MGQTLQLIGLVNKLLSGVPLYGKLLALPTNIRQGWKGLQGTNAPAYWVGS